MRNLKIAMLALGAFGLGAMIGHIITIVYALLTLRGAEIDFMAFTDEPDDWFDRFDEALDWEAAKKAWDEDFHS